MGAARRFGRRVAPFNSFDDRREPVGHIQGASLTGQNVIAQRPQRYGQIAEQDLGGGVVLALAVTANQRNQPVGGGARRVEVVDGLPVWVGVGFVGHCR